MPVKVLFFGATADAAGAREMVFENHERTVRDLLDLVLARSPRLVDHKLLIAVNEEYADVHRALADGDEVAVFTAVSGG